MNNKTLVLALVIAIGTIVTVQANATNQTGGNQTNSSSMYSNPAQAALDPQLDKNIADTVFISDTYTIGTEMAPK